VIGHSLGGFVVQKYLENHDAAGGVLLSSPPPSGMLRTVVKVARRRSLVFARCIATFSLAPMIATPELAREAFYSADFPEGELRAYWKRMEDESYMAFLDMLALDLPKPEKVKAPVLVLGAARDAMVGASDVEATARAYHTQAQIIPGVAHNSMLEAQWERAAERILAWLRDRGM
jgi:pimeloyl-ACP methyl ester carboxylesterase